MRLKAAFAYCEDEVIETLVKAGASLKSLEPKSMGLLHTMVTKQRPSAIKIFLKLGCNWFQEWRGHNALWYAIKYPFHGIHAQDLYGETIDAIAHGHPDGEKGASLYKERGSLSTALHVAARYGNDKVAIKLMKWGALIDERDVFRHTPLWLAASHGHVETALLLIDAGASVDAVGVEGSTPLRVASRNGGVGKNTKTNYVQVNN